LVARLRCFQTKHFTVFLCRSKLPYFCSCFSPVTSSLRKLLADLVPGGCFIPACEFFCSFRICVFYLVSGLVASFPVRLIESCCCNLRPDFIYAPKIFVSPSRFSVQAGAAHSLSCVQLSLLVGAGFSCSIFERARLVLFLLAGSVSKPSARSGVSLDFGYHGVCAPVVAKDSIFCQRFFLLCTSSDLRFAP
jgi:hypothetical protein